MVQPLILSNIDNPSILDDPKAMRQLAVTEALQGAGRERYGSIQQVPTLVGENISGVLCPTFVAGQDFPDFDDLLANENALVAAAGVITMNQANLGIDPEENVPVEGIWFTIPAPGGVSLQSLLSLTVTWRSTKFEGGVGTATQTATVQFELKDANKPAFGALSFFRQAAAGRPVVQDSGRVQATPTIAAATTGVATVVTATFGGLGTGVNPSAGALNGTHPYAAKGRRLFTAYSSSALYNRIASGGGK